MLDRYEQAIGGRERWHRDHSRTMTYDLSLRAPAESGMQEAHGTMIVRRRAPDLMDSTLTVEELGTFRQGYDGTSGWSMREGEAPRFLEGEALAERRREALIDREIRLRELYSTVVVAGERDFAGRPCWLVRFSAEDGAAAQAFFDRESGLMLGFARRLRAGDAPLVIAQTLSDWREQDGLWFPFRIEQAVGSTVQVMTLRSIDHECIDEEAFRAPPRPAPPDAPMAAPAAAPPVTPAPAPGDAPTPGDAPAPPSRAP